MHFHPSARRTAYPMPLLDTSDLELSPVEPNLPRMLKASPVWTVHRLNNDKIWPWIEARVLPKYVHEKYKRTSPGQLDSIPHIHPIQFLRPSRINHTANFRPFTMKLLLTTITFLLPLSFALPTPQDGDSAPAEGCQTVCTMEYNPQCGRDADGNTKIFSNPCVFKRENCENPDQVYTLVELSECDDSVC